MDQNTSPIYPKGIDVVNFIKNDPADIIRNQVGRFFAEVWQSFDSRCYLAAIVLSAETISRANLIVIADYVRRNGTITCQIDGKKHYIRPDDVPKDNDYTTFDFLVEKLSFCHSIFKLRDIGLITEEVFLDMHALRCVRNQVVHSRLPRLDPFNKPSEASFDVKSFYREVLSEPNMRMPLKYDIRKFQIQLSKNKEVTYIVDQVKLGIDLTKVDLEPGFFRESEFAVISIALMQQCIKSLAEVKF
jgi:hypothetical protein